MNEHMPYAERLEQMRGLADEWRKLDENNPLRAVGEIWHWSLVRIEQLETTLRYVDAEYVPLMESHARTEASFRIEGALSPSAAPSGPGAVSEAQKSVCIWPPVRQVIVSNRGWRSRLKGAIELLRGAFHNDGAEGESVHLVCGSAEILLAARDQAMSALAKHDGRSWCAVCGFDVVDCGKRTPHCLGEQARKEFLQGGKE